MIQYWTKSQTNIIELNSFHYPFYLSGRTGIIFLTEVKTEMINKELIKKSFRRSLNTYDQHALVQKQVCEHLAEMILKITNSFGKVLEIGAGTGL